MRSPFRPRRVPDPAILDNHRPLIRSIERRGLIRGGVSLGALTMLTGCDVSDDGAVGQALRAVSSLNDRVQAALFDPNKLAPEYPASMVLKPPRFNAYFDVEQLQPVDGATWRLELAGLIAEKRPWTREQIAALPERETIVRHVCVEGWDYIGAWSGVPLRSFLERVGAALSARYVAFKTVRLSAAAADGDQARLQKPEMDHRDRGDQHLFWRVLGEAGLQLVRGTLGRPAAE